MATTNFPQYIIILEPTVDAWYSDSFYLADSNTKISISSNNYGAEIDTEYATLQQYDPILEQFINILENNITPTLNSQNNNIDISKGGLLRFQKSATAAAVGISITGARCIINNDNEAV